MNGRYTPFVLVAAAVVIYILLSCEGAGCDVPPVEQSESLFDQFMNLWEIG